MLPNKICSSLEVEHCITAHNGTVEEMRTPAPPAPAAPPASAAPPPAAPPPPPVHAKAALPTITVEEMLHQLLHEQRRLAKQQTMHTYATTFVAVVILAYLDRILHRLPPRR